MLEEPTSRTELTPEQHRVVAYFCGEFLDPDGRFIGTPTELAETLRAIAAEQRGDGHEDEAARIEVLAGSSNTARTVPFSSVAGLLDPALRKSLIADIVSGRGRLGNSRTNEIVAVVPDTLPGPAESLFHVSFPGSKRDRIPTQHYLVPGVDQGSAIQRAVERYNHESRRRKGSAIRAYVTGPFGPEDRAP